MESIEVSIRIRPFLKLENPNNTTITIDEEDDRKIRIGKSLNFFEAYYDKVFFQSANQEEIFEFCLPGIARAKKGINCTIMAYGQTGSGKTYTMFGSDWTLDERSKDYIDKKINLGFDKYNFIKNDFLIDPYNETNGIIPRVIMSIFDTQEHNSIQKIFCSYIQIYNEKIYDLLGEEENVQERFNTFLNGVATVNPIKQKALAIREDKINGIYLDGVNEIEIDNFYDCFSILKEGEKNRKKRQTNKNEMSSRSHTIFTINLTINKNGILTKSKINLCDLAGSEKYNRNQDYQSIHFKEMVNINLSLVSLGKVIHELVNNKGNGHIPYKDSKLTQLLQDSLGGNTKTYIIATISPSDDNYEESLSTLKFADRAHSVMSKVEVNDIAIEGNYSQSENLTIKKLAQEVTELKQLLALRTKRGIVDNIQGQLIKLKEENDQLKQLFMSNEPLQRLIKENMQLKQEIKRLTARTQSNKYYHNVPHVMQRNESIDFLEDYMKKIGTPLSNNQGDNTTLSYKENASKEVGSPKLKSAAADVINNRSTKNNPNMGEGNFTGPLGLSGHSINPYNYKMDMSNLEQVKISNNKSQMLSNSNTSKIKSNLEVKDNQFNRMNKIPSFDDDLNYEHIQSMKKMKQYVAYEREVQKSNARLKMLDDMERRNKLRTQMLIDEISKKKYSKRIDYLSK